MAQKGVVMQIGYIGGIVQRGSITWPEVDGWQRWHWQTEDTECCLIAGGAGCRLFDHGDIAVLLRGFVVDMRSDQPRNAQRIADRLHHAYRDTGTLDLDGLEGSFTLVLLDGRSGRALIYRNLIGDSHTYYHERDGVLFGSNLADLLALADEPTQPNETELPAF